MDWISTIDAWASKYIGEYPYWKIYNEKVGANVYAQSPLVVTDSASSMDDLRQNLLYLPYGKYILHLKKTPDAQRGNMETKFERPYSYQSPAAPGIGALNMPPDPSRYVAIDQMHSIVDTAIGKFKAETEAADNKRKLEEAEKAVKKLEKENELLKNKADNKMEAAIGLINAIKPMIPEIKQMFGIPQVGIAGFQEKEPIPGNGVAPAAYTNTPVQDPNADPTEDDKLDDRIYDATVQFMVLNGNDKAATADLLEGLVGYIKTNPGTFDLLKQQILDARKFY